MIIALFSQNNVLGFKSFMINTGEKIAIHLS
jgi:hypothetical protein